MNKLSPKSGLLGLILIALVAFVTALYGQFVDNPILFDDVAFFMLDKNGGQPVSAYHWTMLGLRSLPYATLAWTKAWFGLELINFRIGNLLLHAAVVVSMFFFISALTKGANLVRKDDTTVRLASFFAAMLFAVHPVATYAVGYLVQRSIVMATLFSLLAMLTYISGSLQKNPIKLWMSVPLYYLAVFSKEHAIMLPAVLMALTVLLHDDWLVQLKQRWRLFFALLAIALLVLLTMRGVLGSIYEPNAAHMLLRSGSTAVYPLSLITQSFLFFKYALFWFSPNPTWMSIDMREPFALSFSAFYLVAAGCFIAWGVVALHLLFRRGNKGLVGFAMLFPWVMFFTEFSSVRIQEVFVLYRSYLWAPGAFCFIPILFNKFKVRLVGILLSTFSIAMFAISMERLATFSHPVLLWNDAAKLIKGHDELPGAYRIYFNRGTSLLNVGDIDEAIEDLRKSIEINNDFAEAYGNLGWAYIKKKEWINSIASYNRAIELVRAAGNPINPIYSYGRARAFDGAGDIKNAQIDFQDSCRLANQGCEKLIDLH